MRSEKILFMYMHILHLTLFTEFWTSLIIFFVLGMSYGSWNRKDLVFSSSKLHHIIHILCEMMPVWNRYTYVHVHVCKLEFFLCQRQCDITPLYLYCGSMEKKLIFFYVHVFYHCTKILFSELSIVINLQHVMYTYQKQNRQKVKEEYYLKFTNLVSMYLVLLIW